MKVKELIEKLEKCDPEADVTYQREYHYEYGYEYKDIEHICEGDWHPHEVRLQ